MASPVIKFLVRSSQAHDQSEHATVQEAFKVGGAHEQAADVYPKTMKYPACFFEDAEGRRYGPVLRP